MKTKASKNLNKQHGLSFVGLLFVLGFIAALVLLAAKITPTVIEYNSIKKAIVTAKLAGNSVREIQVSYGKQAEVGYIESVKPNDLMIEKTPEGFEVSFAYEKKIPLFGPASLLLEYQGTTAKAGKPAKKIE
jgi:hypothetical protein